MNQRPQREGHHDGGVLAHPFSTPHTPLICVCGVNNNNRKYVRRDSFDGVYPRVAGGGEVLCTNWGSEKAHLWVRAHCPILMGFFTLVLQL